MYNFIFVFACIYTIHYIDTDIDTALTDIKETTLHGKHSIIY